VVVVAGATPSNPEMARMPNQPSEAVQEVALVDDQVRVTGWPAAIVAGAAENEIVGGTGGTSTGVVTSSGPDGDETFPAASTAATLKA